LERLVEGVFAKAFRSGLQPVEVGRRITREMDLGRTVGVRGVIAPNYFLITIDPSDHERFVSYEEALLRELADAAREHARDEGYHFVGPVEVLLGVDERRRRGDLKVVAEIVAAENGAVGALVLPDGRRVRLGHEPAVIGRLPECAVALSDSQVSRHHAEIRPSGPGYRVVDLGSTNGTLVNDVVVQEQELHDGDVIVIGSTEIRYEES